MTGDGRGTTDPEVVSTTAGRVRGRRRAGLIAWRGIPYAAPPTGALRFSAPRPPEPWDGVREAADHGAVPPQPRTTRSAGAGRGTPMSEDCLTVSVVRRTAAAPPRPVMVFVYGGAFAIGSAGATAYGGEALAARGDVVFVGFNYRLGALGWLDLRRYATADRPVDANPGLRDQLAALHWVRANIAAFGGDPDDITLFGESAGATSVATLMAVPAARGLFHRAILQSSAVGSVYGADRAADRAGDLVRDLAGDEHAADAIHLLEALPAQVLVDATRRLDERLSSEQPGARLLGPVVDGELLPEAPLDAFRAGRTAPVPLIIGTNADEGTLFQRVRGLRTTAERVDRLFELTDPAAKEPVLAAYPRRPQHRRNARLVTDLMFWHPSTVAAAGHSAVAPVHMYRFDHAPLALRAIGLGATHGAELDAVFGRPDTVLQRAATVLGGGRANRAVIARMHGRWIRFARSAEVSEDWPPYDPVRRRTLVVDDLDHVEEDPSPGLRTTWDAWRPYR